MRTRPVTRYLAVALMATAIATQVLAVIVVKSAGRITLSTIASTPIETLLAAASPADTLPSNACALILNNQSGSTIYYQTNGQDASATTSAQLANGQSVTLTGRYADLAKTELIGTDSSVVSYSIVIGDTSNTIDD